MWLIGLYKEKKKFVQGFGWETCKIVTTWQTQACVEDDDIIMDIREVQWDKWQAVVNMIMKHWLA